MQKRKNPGHTLAFPFFIYLANASHWSNPTGIPKVQEPVEADHPSQPSRAEVSLESWAGQANRNIQHSDLLLLLSCT